MTAADLQRHIRYNNWASQLLMDAVRALPASELERPTGISHHSILGTMAHLHFADWIWYTRVVEPMGTSRRIRWTSSNASGPACSKAGSTSAIACRTPISRGRSPTDRFAATTRRPTWSRW